MLNNKISKIQRAATILMEDIDRLAIIKCKDAIMQDLVPSNHFLFSLFIGGVITDTHKAHIQALDTGRNKTAMLLHILPTQGPQAFNKFVTELNKEHWWVTQKILKAKKTIQRERNHNSLKNILDSMSVLVYGKKRAFTGMSQSKFSEENVLGIFQNLIDLLKDHCYAALELPKDPNTEGLPLSQIIRRKKEDQESKIKQQKEVIGNSERKIRSLTTELSWVKGLPAVTHKNMLSAPAGAIKNPLLKTEAINTKQEKTPLTDISKLKMKLNNCQDHIADLEKRIKMKDKKLKEQDKEIKELKRHIQKGENIPLHMRIEPAQYRSPQRLPWD